VDSTSTLQRIRELWSIPEGKSPIEIPNVGRDNLAQLLAYLRFDRGVEVGTERGEYAEVLCKANPNLHLDCVDPYRAYRDYREHTSQAKLDALYYEATARLQNHNVAFVRDFSVDAAHRYDNESIDFVYIDGNHALPYVIQDLVAWVPKVRKDGLIAGHDFIRRNNRLRYQCHVVEAVYAYTQCYMINEWYVLGRKTEVSGEKRDVIRSFMWVKE
jgi:predicted O-methyltransferase YrrM